MFDLLAQGGRRPRSSSGLGIGLSLARRLVEMHGGRIESRSEGAGRGSEFVVRLPASAETAAVTGRIAAADKVRALGAGDVRVLAVDDNVDAADARVNVLKLAGYAATVAYGGATAFELSDIVHPAVVLLDLGLPRLSELDVARRVRAPLTPGRRSASRSDCAS